MIEPNTCEAWIPDVPDFRDLVYSAPLGSRFPARVDLRDKCSPVEDQENIGSCTGNAAVGALELIDLMKGRKLEDLSRLFIYYNARAVRGWQNRDSGAYLRDVVKVLAKDGVCAEQIWPYRPNKFREKPSSKAYRQAQARRITKYERLSSVEDMKACLSEGSPIVFGFSTYESLYTDAVRNTGVVELPKKSEKMLGGHAVLMVGYDDATQRVIFRNSWGTRWGDKGYGTLPYEYVANRNLSDDFWAIRA